MKVTPEPKRIRDGFTDFLHKTGKYNTMRYFFYKIGLKICTLQRLDSNKGIAERWDKGKWVWDATVVDATSGYASDSDNYEEISEQQANKYIKEHTTKKKINNKKYPCPTVGGANRKK